MDMSDIEDSARKITDNFQPRLEDAKRQMETLGEKINGAIKNYPGACLVGAIVLGYAIARVARRERS